MTVSIHSLLRHIPVIRSGRLKKLAPAFSVLVLCLLLQSCNFLFGGYGWDEFFSRDNPVSSRADSLTDIDAPTPSTDTYTVIVITDVHFGGEGSRPDDKFFAWVKALQSAGDTPAFCLSLGDSVEHGYKSEYEDYVSFTGKLEDTYGIKTYTVTGNHDLYNSGWKYWKSMVYPYTSFYRFKTEKFSWYFLDSASGSLGPDQFDTLEDAMKADSKPKIVLMHYPVYADGTFYSCIQNTYERDELITLFAKQNVTLLLDGHTHAYNTYDFGSFYEFNVPGFLAKGQWALLTVNKSTETVSAELIVK